MLAHLFYITKVRNITTAARPLPAIGSDAGVQKWIEVGAVALLKLRQFPVASPTTLRHSGEPESAMAGFRPEAALLNVGRSMPPMAGTCSPWSGREARWAGSRIR